MMVAPSLLFQCRAITDIWTAGENARDNDRLRLTGLLGGIRWWCEAVARGFGVRACDPVRNPCTGNQRCIICGLFGKADPAQSAKFALRAWANTEKTKLFTAALTSNSHFLLEFHFYRKPESIEEYLLVKAMDIISRYGSVGGKTTLKPTRPPHPARAHHADYGLLAVHLVNGLQLSNWRTHQETFEQQMANAARLDPETSDLPALTGFWFLPGKTLFVHPTAAGGDDSINNFLGLQDTTAPAGDVQTKVWPPPDLSNSLRSHMRGIPENSALGPPASSKKVFSFGSMANTNYARSWGYVLDSNLLTQLPGLLTSAGLSPAAVVDGNAVLHQPIG